jgi:hypothetical protein
MDGKCLYTFAFLSACIPMPDYCSLQWEYEPQSNSDVL